MSKCRVCHDPGLCDFSVSIGPWVITVHLTTPQLTQRDRLNGILWLMKAVLANTRHSTWDTVF